LIEQEKAAQLIKTAEMEKMLKEKEDAILKVKQEREE